MHGVSCFKKKYRAPNRFGFSVDVSTSCKRSFKIKKTFANQIKQRDPDKYLRNCSNPAALLFKVMEIQHFLRYKLNTRLMSRVGALILMRSRV